MTSCPLCSNDKNFTSLESIDKRTHKKCPVCWLIFTDKKFLLSPKDERKRYLTHNNGIQYSGYVDFLNQAIEPAMDFLEPTMSGLDFGCGPVPTLSILLERKNIVCKNYDPIFFPEIKEKSFDFIFATECFEHFNNPKKELQKLSQLVKKNGFLIVMTQMWTPEINFAKWPYGADNTHIAFYHQKTFDYIAKQYNFKIAFTDSEQRVIIFKKIN